jgi:hypothetical protein
MTAPRRPRSAWLLVGSTPSTSVKVYRAGQRLSRFLAKRRWYFVLVLLRAACSSSARSYPEDRAGMAAVAALMDSLRPDWPVE